jgi:hypothetical protein
MVEVPVSAEEQVPVAESQAEELESASVAVRAPDPATVWDSATMAARDRASVSVLEPVSGSVLDSPAQVQARDLPAEPAPAVRPRMA